MLFRFSVLCLVLLLGACSFLTGDDGIFRDRKKDYRKAEAVDRMQIPEGMDSDGIVDFYPVPPLSPYAEQELIDQPPLPSGMLVDANEKVRVQRLGQQQWVLVKISPSQLWPRLKEFVVQQPVQLLAENGMQGTMTVTGADGFFRYRVQQGLQNNTAELSVRFSPDSGIVSQWPAQSSDADKEADMLMQLARFLADAESPAYSFAAYNISTEPRLLVQYDDNGNRYLLLMLSLERSRASLLAALQKGGFTEEEGGGANAIVVMFTPALPDDKKPGFWKRLLGIKAKPYDDEVEYAGHRYRFVISAAGNYQRVQAEIVSSASPTPAQQQKELNQQLLRIKGLLL